MYHAPHIAEGPRAWQPAPVDRPWRRLAARQLRRTSAWLGWMARQLAAPVAPTRQPTAVATIEFLPDAEGGHGALFVNGEYAGRLDVNRL